MDPNRVLCFTVYFCYTVVALMAFSAFSTSSFNKGGCRET